MTTTTTKVALPLKKKLREKILQNEGGRNFFVTCTTCVFVSRRKTNRPNENDDERTKTYEKRTA